MKRIFILTAQIFFLLLIFSVFLSSCVSQKQIRYLQKKQKGDTTTFFTNKQATEYKIQPNDNLYIRIITMDEKTNDLFNKNNFSGSPGYVSDASMYFQGYTVSNDGYIEFPLVGKVYVKDLTILQTTNLIQQLVDEYLKETVVIVKMAIFNITILGEVRNPSTFSIYQDKINIFEAVSRAGDLTDFANRSKVYLIRQVKNDSKIFTLDLTSDKILSSDLYYLAPNDIIYVAPLKVKQYGFSTFPYALIFTSISFVLTLITFFKIYNP